MARRALSVWATAMMSAICAPWPRAHAAALPADGRALAFREHPGATLPADAFLDADGSRISLQQVSDGLPMILVLGYFHCPNLCGVVRAGLYRSLSRTDLLAGRDYALVAVSVDAEETPADAREAKAHDAQEPGLRGDLHHVHYLTGKAAAIAAAATAVGFVDRRDPPSGEIMHPAGLVFASPQGRVTSYLLGVGQSPAALRDALADARVDRIQASDPLPVLLLCFSYDPASGKYSLQVLKALRLAAAVSVLGLSGALFLMFRRNRGERRP